MTKAIRYMLASRLRLLLAAAGVTFALCAYAQNNPYKISDSLYPLYRDAHRNRHLPQGLNLADRLYRDAERIGDGKAQCLALTIPVYYYYDIIGDEEKFLESVKALQAKAVATGFRQYYYFGLSNRVGYLLNRNRGYEALLLVQDFERKARGEDDMYGVFFGLLSMAQTHSVRHENFLSLSSLDEALETGTKYLPDQDMAIVYRRMADSYSNIFDYQKMYSAAKCGLEIARTDESRMRLLANMAFAQMKLCNYGEVEELYRRYEKLAGKLSGNGKSLYDQIMMLMKAIIDDDLQHMQQILAAMPLVHNDFRQRLNMELFRREGDLQEFSRRRQKYYDARIWAQDSVNVHDMAEMSAYMLNRKIEFDNHALLVEHQRMDNERRQAEIDHAALKLANTKLSLKNASLEIGRARDEAKVLKLANSNKRLEAERLHGQIGEARSYARSQRLFTIVVMAVFAILLLAGMEYIRMHKRAMQRLRIMYRQLDVKRAELEEQRNKAEAASRVKTEIISKMTHDMYVPLDAIIGFAQLVADRNVGYTSEERMTFFRQISDNTNQMLAVVNGVLEEAQDDGSHVVDA